MNTPTTTLIDELKELANVAPGDPARSKAARLRALLPFVEAALTAGATHAEVLAKLTAHGLEMTPAVFSTTLRRLRRAQKATPAVTNGPPQPQSPQHPPRHTLGELHDLSAPVDMESLISQGKRAKS